MRGGPRGADLVGRTSRDALRRGAATKQSAPCDHFADLKKKESINMTSMITTLVVTKLFGLFIVSVLESLLPYFLGRSLEPIFHI